MKSVARAQQESNSSTGNKHPVRKLPETALEE
jgi:hypothetical protein